MSTIKIKKDVNIVVEVKAKPEEIKLTPKLESLIHCERCQKPSDTDNVYRCLNKVSHLCSECFKIAGTIPDMYFFAKPV
jgi:tRNA G26 N,N-dimethylase Trm1